MSCFQSSKTRLPVFLIVPAKEENNANKHYYLKDGNWGLKNNFKKNVNLSFGYIYRTQRQLFFSYLRSYSTPRFSQEPQTFSGAIWFVTGSCIALPNLPCIHSMTRVTDFCNSLYWVGYNKKTENNKYCQRHEETETLVYCW